MLKRKAWGMNLKKVIDNEMKPREDELSRVRVRVRVRNRERR